MWSQFGEDMIWSF